jgi:putative transposase
LPEADVPAPDGSGLSKSPASRHFVALSAARLKEWMARDLSGLGLLVIQIDGIHMDEKPPRASGGSRLASSFRF